jgi:hypothetical protein
MTFKINGTAYAVGVASVSRRLRQTEKYRVTTEDGSVHREVQATYQDFTLSLGNLGTADYDSLMAFLTSCTSDVTLELPMDAGSTQVYTGLFSGIADAVLCDDGTETIWDNFSLTFTGTIPLGVGE